jgi:hypothetical protein
MPFLVALPSSSSAADPLVYGNVSGWTVWTDPSQQYSCFAEARYEGASSIRAGFDAVDGTLYVSFDDASWSRVVANREYELELEFDDGTAQAFRSTGLAEGKGVRFTVPDERRGPFVDAFIHGYWVSVTPAALEPVMLSLGGSSAAMGLLEECQDSMAEFN